MDVTFLAQRIDDRASPVHGLLVSLAVDRLREIGIWSAGMRTQERDDAFLFGGLLGWPRVLLPVVLILGPGYCTFGQPVQCFDLALNVGVDLGRHLLALGHEVGNALDGTDDRLRLV